MGTGIRFRIKGAAAGAAVALAALVVAVTPLPASAATIISLPASGVGAQSIANVAVADPTTVAGASFLAGVNNQNGTSNALSFFPTLGSDFGILTTGLVQSADDTNTNVPDSSSDLDDKTTDLNGGSRTDGPHARGNSDFDVSILKLDLATPGNANCLVLDFAFYSEEFAEFVGTEFNDAFIAEYGTSTWTTSGSAISAPDNFAFSQGGAVVSINSLGVGMNAPNAAGTTYDGATTLLQAATPAAAGTNSLYLSIFDQGDQILDSAAFIDNVRFITVANPAVNCKPGAQPKNPPSADAGGPYTVNEGSTVQLDGTGTDPDGELVTFSWSPAGQLDDATLEDPTYSGIDDNVEALTLTVANPFAQTDSDTAMVETLNVPPSISALNVPIDPVAVGTPITATAPFSDPGTADTHTSDFSWGDSTTSPGSGSPAAGTHTYTSAGVYEVSATVTDDDGGFDTKTAGTFVVVYDPSAGFVTGGGHIASPAGAYAADPSSSGRANFGFVSKYKKGSDTPEGTTEFQFQTVGLNFHSSDYQWLVVSGPMAQYKGTGTINGDGGYGFMVTATDGQAQGGGGTDKFRMKIWELSSGDVVYDNKAGSSDAIDQSNTQALSGGSIVIHKAK